MTICPFPLSNWSDPQLDLLSWAIWDLEQWRAGGYSDMPDMEELKDEILAEKQRRRGLPAKEK